MGFYAVLTQKDFYIVVIGMMLSTKIIRIFRIVSTIF